MITLSKALAMIRGKPSSNGIDPKWLEQARDQTLFTPDMWKLQQHRTQLLFVCDDMMEGRRNFGLIKEHAVNVSGAFTTGRFRMWKKDLGKESFLIPIETTPEDSMPICAAHPARIKGQVYAVVPARYSELDTHMLNGVQYLRRKVRIEIPYRMIQKVADRNSLDEETQKFSREVVITTPVCSAFMSVWMYVGISSYWDDQIDNYHFSPVKTYQPKTGWKDAYYYYSIMEDKNL